MRSAEGLVTPQDIFTPNTVQQHALGTRLMLIDGRVFRYAQAGAVDLVAGNLLQGAVPVANHLALTAPVVAVGATSFTVTPGATAGAANLYAEGYLGVDTTPGNGLTYRVASHPAIGSSTAFTISLDEPIAVAFTAATRFGLMANLYKNVLQVPSVKTAAIVGLAPVAVTAASFAWIQTWGPCSALIVGTPVVNAPLTNSATVAGAVDAWASAVVQAVSSYVGEMMQVGVAGKNNFIYLKIAP